MQKRLMILGAGPNQLPGIKKAVNLGYKVITVDNIPDSIGHKYSHQYVNCSTVDKEGVLKAAVELNVDGVVTFASDVAIPTLGYIAEQLGLTGPGQSAAETMANKAKFRVFQSENRLNHPKFGIAKRFVDFERQITKFTSPLIFKPVDTSGSRGVSRVDDIDHERCLQAFKYAQGYSQTKTVCVEEFLKGIEVGGDAFLKNGKLEFIAITHKHMQGYLVTGHSLPTNISEEEQLRVHNEILNTCKVCGYKDGPLNFDVMVFRDRATIIEMSPRLGGNGIPKIIERGIGADLIGATILHALGYSEKLNSSDEVLNLCGSYVFGSDKPGILKGIMTQAAMRGAIPAIFEFVVVYKIGDKVPQFIHNGNSIGYILFDCPGQESYYKIVEKLKRELHMEVV